MTTSPDGHRRNNGADNSPGLGGAARGPATGLEPRLGGRNAVPELLAALRGRDLQARLSAGRILKAVRDPQAVQALIEALDDDLAQVRSASASALGAIVASQEDHDHARSGLDVVAVLIETLRDRAIPVRMAAARALGQTRDRRALRGLLDALKDISPHVRAASAEAIGKIGEVHPEEGVRTLPTLIGLLNDHDSAVRTETAEALGRIGGACTAPRARAYAVPALLNAFRDPGVQVRSAAAEALRQIGPDAVPGLVRALRDDEMQVRSAAAWVIRQIGDQYGKAAARAVQPLLDALDDIDERVRWYAVGALGVLRDPRAVPRLVRLLDDDELPPGEFDEQRICDVAAEALEKIGTPEARAAVRIWRVARAG